MSSLLSLDRHPLFFPVRLLFTQCPIVEAEATLDVHLQQTDRVLVRHENKLAIAWPVGLRVCFHWRLGEIKNNEEGDVTFWQATMDVQTIQTQTDFMGK